MKYQSIGVIHPISPGRKMYLEPVVFPVLFQLIDLAYGSVAAGKKDDNE